MALEQSLQHWNRLASTRGLLNTGPSHRRRTFVPLVEDLEQRWNPAALVDLPIDVTEVRLNESTNQLEALISLAGGEAQAVPLSVGTTDAPEGSPTDCPILNLELGEIDLNVLGLGVATSEICLDVTATDDQGLLGGLLCDLTGGLDLAGILGQLDDVTGQVEDFLGTLEDLLDTAFGQEMAVTGVLGTALEGTGTEVAQEQVEEGICDILNLSLGPVDLDVPLLGVSVALDNCADGPVTVDVTGDPEGGLLGDVLCGLAGGIDVDDVNVDDLVARIDGLVDQLGGLVDRLGDLEELDDVPRNIENQLSQLTRLADRVSDVEDIDRLIGRVDRVADRVDKLIDRLEGQAGGGADQATDRIGELIDRLEERLTGKLDDLSDKLTARLEKLVDRLG